MVSLVHSERLMVAARAKALFLRGIGLTGGEKLEINKERDNLQMELGRMADPNEVKYWVNRLESEQEHFKITGEYFPEGVNGMPRSVINAIRTNHPKLSQMLPIEDGLVDSVPETARESIVDRPSATVLAFKR